MTWTYASANASGEVQGKYLLRRDGVDSAMVSFVDSVEHQAVIMGHMVEILNFHQG